MDKLFTRPFVLGPALYAHDSVRLDVQKAIDSDFFRLGFILRSTHSVKLKSYRLANRPLALSFILKPSFLPEALVTWSKIVVIIRMSVVRVCVDF